ncbi:hypothetical protein [Desulfosporosinus acidiphilus]|uniref:hypothetical protein n=1 Tax=Desulfosporosinus acidiphilus TaxID=885581 RepID=UPI001A9A5ED9|nr:hypothetical protein [Desulfosporosinus acidiphilus]
MKLLRVSLIGCPCCLVFKDQRPWTTTQDVPSVEYVTDDKIFDGSGCREGQISAMLSNGDY